MGPMSLIAFPGSSRRAVKRESFRSRGLRDGDIPERCFPADFLNDPGPVPAACAGDPAGRRRQLSRHAVVFRLRRSEPKGLCFSWLVFLWSFTVPPHGLCAVRGHAGPRTASYGSRTSVRFSVSGKSVNLFLSRIVFLSVCQAAFGRRYSSSRPLLL